jgi:3-dehydroquinate dehydratase/shikimate dehydrogenase
VNTLCFRDGKPFGYNTDCYAAVASVATALRRDATNLADLRVHVLGAGGAARAILEGFGEAGCQVTVFARSFAKAAKLGEHFQCDAAPWEERGRQTADLLINTTPVGLWPNLEESPMNDFRDGSPGSLPQLPAADREAPIRRDLSGYRLVFDLIYRPLETKLLREAQAAGCQTLNGLDMFLRQAAVQFELWTGIAPSIESPGEMLTQAANS